MVSHESASLSVDNKREKPLWRVCLQSVKIQIGCAYQTNFTWSERLSQQEQEKHYSIYECKEKPRSEQCVLVSLVAVVLYSVRNLHKLIQS